MLAIAGIAGGCRCSLTCYSETRLTASVYLGKKGIHSPCDPIAKSSEQIKNYIIVTLITDKIQLASVDLPDLLESSQTQVNFDFMRFFNWSDKEKFVTRSNIVIAPMTLVSDASNPSSGASKANRLKKGVILYPDRDPNGMLYIVLVLIERCQSNGDQPKKCLPADWMNKLASINTLNATSRDGPRLWPLWNDLSAQSSFTAAILSNVESDNIVSWNTFSFFEDEKYGFSNEDLEQSFPLPINGSSTNGFSLCLEVTAWNHTPF